MLQMKNYSFLLCLCCVIVSFQYISSQATELIAGNGGSGFNGDGLAATSTNFYYLFGVWGDSIGNIYLADQMNNRIRKMDSDGIVTTVAGSGGASSSGGSGPATSIRIGYPWGIAGYEDFLYFADEYLVWELNLTSGTMSNIVGPGTLNDPAGVAVSSTGIIYVADYSHRIFKIADGHLTVFAGSGTSGYCGDGGPATNACLYYPWGVWVNTDGVVFIADSSNNRVRYVTTEGKIYTFAGGGSGGGGVGGRASVKSLSFGDGGLASEANLSNPSDVKGDSLGNVFIVEYNGYRIRMVDTNNIISTFRSIPSSSYGIWVDANDGVYFTQYYYLYRASGTLTPTIQPTLEPTFVGTGLIAGNGNWGFHGDGFPAISTSFYFLYGVWGDDAGNIYLADQSNNRIRKMDSRGIVTTVAGSGGASSSGGSGPATSLQIGYPWGIVGYQGLLYFADEYFLWELDLSSGMMSSVTDLGVLSNPSGVTVSSTGIVYVSDYSHRIHQVSGGNLTLFAGTGTGGYCGDEGLATEACLCLPWGLWVNATGVVFIADSCNNRVRYVTTEGFIYTFAGGGNGGDGGLASEASLANPSDVKGDSLGNVFIVEYDSYQIRMVDTNNIITTLCSTLSYSYGIWIDATDGVYFTQPYYLYKVGASSAPTFEPTLAPTLANTVVVAGNGNSGFNRDGLAATSTRFNSLFGVWGDDEGNIYLADYDNYRIRKIGPSGIVTTVAGSGGFATVGGAGPATSIPIGYPWGIVGYEDLIFFSDEYFLWQLDLSSGMMSNITNATVLNSPTGVAVSSTGIIYVADYSHRIHQITGGNVTAFAGSGNPSYCGDEGPATEACLCDPYGMWVNTNGVLFIADYSNNRVRCVTTDGYIYTFAGGGNGGDSGADVESFSSGAGGLASEATLSSPSDVKGDLFGNVFIVEYYNYQIRMVDTNNIITTICSTPSSSYGIWVDVNDEIYFTQPYYLYKAGGTMAPTFEPTPSPTRSLAVIAAGSGNSGFNGDGFAATSTRFDYLYGVWGDAEGNIYLSDSNNYRIRKVDPNGIVTTVAGSGSYATVGGSGRATSIAIGNPWGIAGFENWIYFADQFFVWELDLSSGVMSTVAGNGTFDGDNGPATAAALNIPSGIAVSSTGIIYVAEFGNHRIRKIENGIMTAFAGSDTASYCGDGGPATEACLYSPMGLWTDSNGAVFIADYNNNRVRQVSMDGFIFTFAGGGSGGDGGIVSGSFADGVDSGLASEASLSSPYDVKGDLFGNVYIAEVGYSRIRMVDTNNIITTYCSTPSEAYGIWINAKGEVYFTQYYYLYKAGGTMAPTFEPTPSPTHSQSVVIAGNGNSGFYGDGFAATSTSFNVLYGVWGDSIGNIYLSDQMNSRIRKIGPNGIVTTVAGAGGSSSAGGAGPATSIPIGYPWGIAGYENFLYFADEFFLWELDLHSETMSSVTDLGVLNTPSGVAVSTSGIVYVSDFTHKVYQLSGGNLTIFAGTGTADYCGDEGPATDACLWYPYGMWVNATGIVFIADYSNERVRYVTTDGIIYTFAGRGTQGDGRIVATSETLSGGGDSGLASNAFLSGPYDVKGDLSGNIFIAESGNNRIRMVDTNNIITTYCSTPSSSYGIWIGGAGGVYFTQYYYLYQAGGTMAPTFEPTLEPTLANTVVAAGNGNSGFNGDGYPATSTSFNDLYGVWGDDEGNIYLADYDNNRIRKIGPNGIVTTVAGSGGSSSAGGSGPATSISIGYPWGVAGYGNMIYFSDEYFMWELNLHSQTMSNITDSTVLDNPTGVTVSSTGIIYVADFTHRVQRISGGNVTTFAGSGTAGYCGDDGPATDACLFRPYGLWMNTNGVVFIADYSNDRVRCVNTEGFIYTFAGRGGGEFGALTRVASFSSGDGGLASEAPLSKPSDVKGDSLGNVFIVEYYNYRIRMVDTNNIIRTICSTPSSSYGIWIDANGEVYFTQPYYLFKAGGTMASTFEPTLEPTHSLSGVVAGNGNSGYNGDGFPATSTSFNNLFGVWGDDDGNIYLSDQDNYRIRKIGPSGIVTTVAGLGGYASVGGSGPATSIPIGYPWGIVGYENVIYFCDQYFVWELNLRSGTMSTVAGNGDSSFDGDNGPASAAALNTPTGVTVSSTGIIYIADYGNHRIRKIETGIITTVAGTGNLGYCGDNGPATDACLYYPIGLWVDSNGVLFIADYDNNRVRQVSTDGFIYTFAGGGSGGDGGVAPQVFSGGGDSSLASEVSLSQPYDVKGDLFGNVYIAEVGHYRIRVVDTNNIITTYCSTPSEAYGIWIDAAGEVYFTQPSYLYKAGGTMTPTIEPTPSPTHSLSVVVAGNDTSGFNGDGYTATSTIFNYLTGVWGDTVGNIYLSDQSNNRIRKINTNGTVTTAAGMIGGPDTVGGSGPATSVHIAYPWGIAGYENLIYFSDQFFVWKLDLSSETMSTVAGNGGNSFDGDNGPSTAAALNTPTGIAVSSTGIVYVADFGNHRIRKIENVIITTFAGSGSPGYCGDDGPATEGCLWYPFGLWVNTNGVVFIADYVNYRVRQVTTDGHIHTFAGGGNGGDRELATKAFLSYPCDVKGDLFGNVFIAEPDNYRIRVVDTNNIITTYCSAPSPSYGIWVDAAGEVYFTQPYSLYKANGFMVPFVEPTPDPTPDPKSDPTAVPSGVPTEVHSYSPTGLPTSLPSTRPSSCPSSQPSSQPTSSPSGFPSTQPTMIPSSQPTSIPSCRPSSCPSFRPFSQPKSNPIVIPSTTPTMIPTLPPTYFPSTHPSCTQPSSCPTAQPTGIPSSQPSSQPTGFPSSRPSSHPSTQPNSVPSAQPTFFPSRSPSSQPSSFPSSQPTTGPSKQPNSKPSSLPSSHPTIQPSTSPTSVPAIKPSSRPNGSPTSVPSGSPRTKPSTIPSALPTCQPSGSPTVVPSSHPTRQPSSQPSTQPVSHPTGQPTSHPSINTNPLHPTRAPVTAAPTLSLSSLWNMKLKSSVTSLSSNDSSAIIGRETFIQRNNWLDPTFNSKSICPSWNSFISSQLYPALLNDLIPVSLTATIVNSPKDNIVNATIKCSDKSSVSSIVAALISTYQNSSSNSRQVTCSGNDWKIKRCSPDVLSVCINCQDPCITSVSNSKLLYFSPCRDYSSQTVLVTSFSLLSVSFAVSPLAPRIISKAAVVNKTSVIMNVRLSSNGLLYYGVFSDVRTSLPTISTILLQNRVATVLNNHSTAGIQALQPATNYSIYFVTKSVQGIQMSVQEMIKSKTSVTTLCCRPLQLRIASQTIVAGETYFNGLTVKSDAALFSSSLSVRPIIYQVKSSSSQMVPYLKQGLIFPSSAVLQGSVNSVSFTLSNLTVGDYAVTLAIEGSEANLYSVVPSGTSFDQGAGSFLKLTVQSKFEPLPAPLITTTVFSDDGSSVIINFDRTTNLGGLTPLFPCNTLFNFSCVMQSQCQWMDSKTVSAYLNGGDSCVKPHDRIYYHSAVSIKAACSIQNGVAGGCFNYSGWPSTPATSMTILPPVNPVVPTVSVSMPTLVGQCSPLQMDLSSSTGNGGRAWKTVTIAVTSSSPNMTVFQNYLKSRSFDPSLPITVPAVYLLPGSSYNFIITLCNFLGQCSPKSQKVVVGANMIPSVRFAGSNLRNIGVYESFSISAVAALSRCGEDSTKQSFYNFEYKWNIYQGTTILNVISTAKDPSKFILPAYSLQLNTGYQVQVTASYQGSASSVSTQITIISGELIPLIQGGNDRVVRAGASLLLDGSKSYDQNKKDSSGLFAGLSYSWSCFQISPSLQENCNNVFGSFPPLLSTESILLTASSSAVNYVAQITMTVLDVTTSRSANIVVKVTVLSPVSASIALQSTAALNIINPGQSLQITGLVQLPNISYFNATWSSSTAGFDLSSTALTPLRTAFIPKSAAAVVPVYLKLSTAGLQGGLAYSFSLVCSLPSPGSSTTASIVVKVNTAPRPGRFLVNPSEGVELSDPFTFSCSQWQDENLPLQYRFAVLTPTGSRVFFVSLSEISYKTLQLPAGDKSNGYSLSCLADIVDSLGANSTGSASVIVKEQQQGAAAQTAQLQNYFNQSANVFASDDVNAIKQAAGMASYLINKVNCSLASHCADLNRQSCFRTAKTCGPCLSENYIGVKGDSNEKCYKSVSDIPVTISEVPKSCGGNGKSCSGHGICVYKSLVTNQNTPSCFENDFSCVPVCFCDVGFTSSPSCDVSDEQAAIKMVYRENLLTGIQSLISTEDVSDGSISDWINNLSDATRITGELSSSSVLKAIEIADTITATAQKSGSSSSSLLAILDSLDSICSAQISNNQGNRRRQLADGDSSSLLVLQSSVEKYSYFIATSLIPGQEPVIQLKSNIRLYMFAVKPAELSQDSSNCDFSTLVMLPQSSAEKILGVQPNFIVVPTCKRTSGSSDSLQIAVSSLSNEIYQNSYNSDPLSLSLSSFPCSDANCKVKIIMKRDATSSLNASMIEAQNRRRFNTSCGFHDYSVHYFDCPNGHRYNVTCRGKEEIIVGRCPRITEIPSCNSLSGSNVVQNSCEMLSYTKKNVTCLCSLLGLSSSRRSLLLANDSSAVIPDKDIHVNYVAMLEAVTGNFESTVLSAGSLNANMIEKGWQAMVTIGTLIGAIVIAMFLSLYADKENQRIEVSENQMKNKALSFAAKLQPTMSFKMRAPLVERKERARADPNNVLQLAEESLPQILGSKSFVAKMKVELKRHHRWFGVVYHYSHKLSRFLRVVSLANNIIIMLFVQSLTYELTNGNDGTCERLTSEQSCLEPQSAYSTGQSKCFWDPSVGEEGKCGYIQPDNSVEVILFVAIFSALITTPFALLADRIIVHVLAAPTLSTKSKIKQLKVMDVQALEHASSIVPRTVLKLKMEESKEKEEQEKKLWSLARRKFESLTEELRKYKELLTDPKERKEFEGKKKTFDYVSVL
jgi:hypothetical protein